MSERATRAVPLARRAADSRPLRHLARAGLLSYALLHVLVAWLALQLAWGGGQDAGSADSSGALEIVASSPLGPVLLWLVAVGLGGLCVWQAVEVLRHHRRLPAPGPDRREALVQVVKTVGTAVLYGYLCGSAVRAALGDRTARADEQDTVRGVLAWPAGQLIVVAVAAVVVGIGGYTVRKGLRSDFLVEIDLSTVAEPLRALTHRASQVGFVLKGVALLLVGGIVAWAAFSFDAAKATGLDGALRTVATEPYGRAVLTAIATGLAAFAVYCTARARHPVG